MAQRSNDPPVRRADPPPRPGFIAGLTGSAAKPAVRPPPGWVTVASCLLLTLAVWFVFGQTVHHQFINFDDDVYVYGNSTITQGLSLGGIAWAFTHRHGDNWHPLTSLSHMMDCDLYGLEPGGHHLTNVLLHAATAILFLLVFRKLTGAFWPSAFVAAVFAIHPLRAESVAWVAERKDVLSGLFFVLTLGAYVRSVRRLEARPGTSAAGPVSPALRPLTSWDYWLVLLLFTLGLLSKPMLVTLPFVLLLLDYWPLNRLGSSTPNSQWPTARQLVWEKVPLLLLSAGSCVATLIAQENLVAAAPHPGFWSRIGNALVAYTVYVRQMLYPSGLAAIYPHPGNQLSGWTVGVCVVVLSAITVGAVRWRRERPYLLVGWLWYLGMLVPVIGLVQVGDQARADRYTYLPHLGLYVMVAWAAVDLIGDRRGRRVVVAAAAAVILTALLVLARTQTRYWRDSVSLWTRAVACTPENYFARNNLGAALGQQGKWSEAIPLYEQALQLKPDSAEIHNNLGVALGQQQKWPEAIEHYERAVQVQPDYAQAHHNLGYALGQQRRWNEAVPHFEREVQLNPDSAEAHNSLGVALGQQGRWKEAIPHFQRALALNPASAEARYNLDLALGQQAR